MASDQSNDKLPKEKETADNSQPSTSSPKDSKTGEPPVLNDAVSSPPPASGSTVKASADKKPEPSAKSAQPAAKKEKKSRGFIAWLALLIALAALAGVAYGLWLLQQTESGKAAEQSRLNESQARLVDGFKSSTKDLSAQVQAFSARISEQDDSLLTLQAQLQATSRQVGEVTQVSRRSWMLAEAEYLLRLANQRLLMERETESAEALLLAADEIMASVAEPGLFEVREALASELAALRALGHLDVEGAFVKLSALGEQVETLALLAPRTDEAEQAASQSETSAPTDEKTGMFRAALENFAGMVKIRHRDVPLEPLLTPEQHYYIQQSLRLMLEQAQLALLQRKPAVFNRSLEKAATWIEEYFQLNEGAQAILAALRDLEGLNVNPALPDISASLALLKAYMAKPMPGDQSPRMPAVSLPGEAANSGDEP